MMAKTAADVQANVAAQRAGVGQFLAGQGAGNIGQSLGAAGLQVEASKIPMDRFAQLASIYYGVPQQSYSPDFRGTQGSNTTKTDFGFTMPKFPGM